MVAGAPTPVAPFSHAVESGGWCFVTGQMPTDPEDDSRPLAPDIEGQTVRVMENLKIVLGGLGLGLEHVLQARIYLTRFEEDYAPMNADLRELLPGRSTAGAHLHRRHRPGARRAGRDRPAGPAARSDGVADRGRAPRRPVAVDAAPRGA